MVSIISFTTASILQPECLLWLKEEMCSKLLFLAKSASHKLYCNYPSDDDFYHLGHLGHMRSLPSPFKLSVTGQIRTSIAHSFTFSLSSFFFFSLFAAQVFFSIIIPLLLAGNIQVMAGAGQTLNLLFSVSKHAVFRDLFPGGIWL